LSTVTVEVYAVSREAKIEYPISAGGVVYRWSPGLEVLLCGRHVDGNDENSKGFTRWHLPKGTPESGESTEETALREVREETGCKVEIEKYLLPMEYSFQNQKQTITFNKTVHFYLMYSVGGDINLHDQEFDEVKWMTLTDAQSLLGYENEQAIVKYAGDYLLGLVDTSSNHG